MAKSAFSIACKELVLEDLPKIGRAVAEPLKVAGSLGIIITVIAFNQSQQDRDAAQIEDDRALLGLTNNKITALNRLIGSGIDVDGSDVSGSEIYDFHADFDGRMVCWNLEMTNIRLLRGNPDLMIQESNASYASYSAHNPYWFEINYSNAERMIIMLNYEDNDDFVYQGGFWGNIRILGSNLTDALLDIKGQPDGITIEGNAMDGLNIFFDTQEIADRHMPGIVESNCLVNQSDNNRRLPFLTIRKPTVVTTQFRPENSCENMSPELFSEMRIEKSVNCTQKLNSSLREFLRSRRF